MHKPDVTLMLVHKPVVGVASCHCCLLLNTLQSIGVLLSVGFAAAVHQRCEAWCVVIGPLCSCVQQVNYYKLWLSSSLQEPLACAAKNRSHSPTLYINRLSLSRSVEGKCRDGKRGTTEDLVLILEELQQQDTGRRRAMSSSRGGRKGRGRCQDTARQGHVLAGLAGLSSILGGRQGGSGLHKKQGESCSGRPVRLTCSSILGALWWASW